MQLIYILINKETLYHDKIYKLKKFYNLIYFFSLSIEV
jgi:hypothetical protein